ncbi:hypothetical protein P3T76_002629 [Phytophthora citrophthora]|uniref:Uncharacterized protein n=1 Tax=Phytophthora citrophthora TaxID=4793 RepID=A0AAD9GVY9_9STRA|nr:hypothetical protein P3T76_002629 [Phytophthora citrophthora]
MKKPNNNFTGGSAPSTVQVLPPSFSFPNFPAFCTSLGSTSPSAMSTEPIRFGDVIKLQTKSAFVETSSATSLGFFEVPGKTQTQLLVVPPVKDEAKDRFVEAEFIIAPIRGEKQQANGTPLTYQTPFVLRTSDGKDGSTYTLNNKVSGHREGISLQLSATKGEMYIQVEKEGNTNSTGLHYGEDSLNLRVVDSNRVRKTLNQLLTHVVKPKSETPGGIVTCGAKGSALTFSFQRALDSEGKAKTETIKYIKNPQARRSSMDALSPAKLDELGRADRIDSSDSDADALSRSSSIAGFGSNPASPRAGSMTGMAAPVNAAAVAARLPTKTVNGPETEATASTSSPPASSNEPSTSATPATETKSKDAKKAAKTPKSPKGKPDAAPASPVKTAAAPASSPVKTASSPAKADSKKELVKTNSKKETIKNETATSEPAKVEPVMLEAVKPELKVETKPEAKAEPVKTTSTPPLAPAQASGEPKTVLADASTFPPIPAINGPAPAPVVVSPKAVASPKPNPESSSASANFPASPKIMKEEEVAKLKAEAEVENLEPACGAKCSVM